MTKKQDVSKVDIANYWETRPPQVWYSDKTPLTREWFNELAYKRYKLYYDFIPEAAEFAHHGGEKVLEVGVGIGTDLVQYAKHGARVSGIDLTQNAVETTRRNFELNCLEYETLQQGDAEKLDFPDNNFDLVFSNGVLHHTPNTDKAIGEIHRVLKPNGKAIVLLYARGWKHYVKRMFIHGVLCGELFRHGYDKTVSNQTEVHGGSPLTYLFKKREIIRMFSQFGEVDIQRYRLGEYFDYAPYLTKKVPAQVLNIMHLLALEKVLGEDFIIKAEKKARKHRPSFWSTWLKP